MNSDLIVFIVLAIASIAAAMGMVFSRNAVYSALFLVLNFVTVAVFYLLLGAPFIAMSQVTVYAGAIMVLFLFVIMLLGAERIKSTTALPWQRPLALGLALILTVEAIYLIISRAQPGLMVTAPEASVNTVESLREMALALYGQYMLPFEITSIVLLVAMVGAIVLTKQEKAGQG